MHLPYQSDVVVVAAVVEELEVEHLERDASRKFCATS